MRKRQRTTPHVLAALALAGWGCSSERDVVARASSNATDGTVTVPAADGSFAIDATEVTVSEYAAWLVTAPLPDPADPVCGWNPTYVPHVGDDVDPFCASPTWEEREAAEPNQPVACVDWCDARDYCAAVGKRLCGRVGGGLLPAEEAGSANSEWTLACSNGGERAFPYGNEFDVTACNGMGSGYFELPTSVGEIPTCEGGVPGLFDMSGNVSEWVDSCYPDANPVFASCARLGGAYYQPGAAELACSSVEFAPRQFLGKAIGIRCCAAR